MKADVVAGPSFIGAWRMPSGNTCDVYITDGQFSIEWDSPPSSAWPREDVEHYQRQTFPAIVRAVAMVTGKRVLGVLV